MDIYYMRDNHTFRNLGIDVEKAKQSIREEFDDGYTHGVIFTKDAPIEDHHANGDIELFLSKVDKFYTQALTIGMGAGI